MSNKRTARNRICRFPARTYLSQRNFRLTRMYALLLLLLLLVLRALFHEIVVF